MFSIRPYRPDDWPQLWPMLQSVFASGETYAFSPDCTEAEIHTAWIDVARSTCVAVNAQDEIIGSYFLKSNQPGLGAHVSNCGYVVAASARGQGVATALCNHSQETARSFGYRAMQFNFVVSTNEVAVRLWQRLGFAIVGTLPGAFKHHQKGYVDAYVIYKSFVAT